MFLISKIRFIVLNAKELRHEGAKIFGTHQQNPVFIIYKNSHNTKLSKLSMLPMILIFSCQTRVSRIVVTAEVD